MPEKAVFPRFGERNWWTLRNQLKKSVPTVVTVPYLTTVLGLGNEKSARNLLPVLRQLGLVDAEGRPTDRANAWRNDDTYSDACAAMIAEVYPKEIVDVFPESTVDQVAAKRWFMARGLGDG